MEPGTIRAVMPLARRVACTTDGSRLRAGTQDGRHRLPRAARDSRRRLSRATPCAVRFAPWPADLFTGGSRARAINRALMGVLPDLLAEAQVIHVSSTLTWPE
jgi:hypothetical protein